MDGVFRCLASPVPLKVGGRTVLLRPLTIARMGVCEQFLMSRRPDPVRSVEEAVSQIAMNPDSAKRLWWKVYEDVKADRTCRYVSRRDFQEWLSTYEGCYFSAWLCLRRSGPEFASLESSRDFFMKGDRDFVAAYCRARQAASGTDMLSTMELPGEKGGEDRAESRIPWRGIFRELAERFNWTPRDVGRLTLWNLHQYRCEEGESAGRKRLSGDDMRNHVAAATGRQRMSGAEMKKHLAGMKPPTKPKG